MINKLNNDLFKVTLNLYFNYKKPVKFLKNII